MLRCASAALVRRIWLPALVLAACRPAPRDPDKDPDKASAVPHATTVAVEGQGADPSPCAEPAGRAGAPCPDGEDEADAVVSCEHPLPIWADGRAAGVVCPERAAAEGLIIVDLGDDWAPRVLAGSPDLGPVPYRERYLRLAREQFGEDDTWYRARQDRFLELYGIFPTPSLVAERLMDDERHACHGAVSRQGLETIEVGIDTWRPVVTQRGDEHTRQSIEEQLKTYARQLDLPSFHELEDHSRLGPIYAKYRRLTLRYQTIAEAQAHFRCEGLLAPDEGIEGILDGPTVSALQAYLRRHMVISWQIDDEARRIMLTDSRELDLLQLLRTLRERVVDATGLIEDGTALGERGKIADRIVDTATFLDERAPEALPGAAHDLVSEATDAAARALGWTSVGGVRAFFAGDPPSRVALRLPDPPAYHEGHMELRLVIDRGDVWYDFPFHPSGDRYPQPRERKPMTILYAQQGDDWVPLVRWPTTIGGWQPERLGNGEVKLVYKESPAGARIVRDVVAAPRWIPPSSTPARDLFRPLGGGEWSLKHDTMGPDYASAYGLVMLIHHRVDEQPDGTIQLTDQGIRSHGSVSYDSILEGFSHGCHRLHNHRAVRLSGFLLGHRRHQAKGKIPLDWARSVVWRGKRHRMRFESRGFRYELDPPLEVEVLRGRVFGRSDRPLLPRSLTRPMLKRYH